MRTTALRVDRLDDRLTPAAVDLSFGTNGRLDWPYSDAWVQPDGRIVAWRAVRDEPLVRLDRSGRPDPTYSRGSADALRQLGATGDRTVEMAADGSLFVAGRAADRPALVIVRLTPDGIPDPAFDGDGVRIIDGWAFDRTALLPRPGGGVWVRGDAPRTPTADPDRMTVRFARLAGDGRPDPGYGGGTGEREVTLPRAYGSPRGGEALRGDWAADGRTYLLVDHPADGPGGNRQVGLARLTPAGDPDPDYPVPGAGFVTRYEVNDDSYYDRITGTTQFRVAAFGDGSAVVGWMPRPGFVGQYMDDTDFPWTLARWRPDGSRDTGYGGPDGTAVLPSSPTFGGDGSAAAALVRGAFESDRFAGPDRVERLAADGRPDPTFGGPLELANAVPSRTSHASAQVTLLDSLGGVYARVRNDSPNVPAGDGWPGFLVRVAAPPAGRPLGPPAAGGTPFAAAFGPAVGSYTPDGSARYSVTPFPGFTGSVRTASADVTGDGVPDVIAGTGPGAAARVVVLDGVTRAEVRSLAPFEDGFTGGVFVAAGDIDADGRADLVVTPDEGGGPRVDVYSGDGSGKLTSFFAIDDANFRGGCRAAVGDLDADGFGDLLVSAGVGGGPRIAGFSGSAAAAGGRVKLFADFFAFEESLRNGAYVAAGDVDADGCADAVFGGGPGGGPRVLVLSGVELLANRGRPLADYFAGDAAARDGVRVAVKELDADGRADVLAAGDGRVTGWAGKALAGGPLFEMDAGAAGGVFVG